MVIFQGGLKDLDVVESASVSTIPAGNEQVEDVTLPIDGKASNVVPFFQEQINAQPKLVQGEIVGNEAAKHES